MYRFAGLVALFWLTLMGAVAAQTGGPPPAGVIPATLTLNVTGTPAIDGDALFAQIHDALDREIRPTLRPGATLTYGAVNPWPLLPLAAGSRMAVNVGVTIAGDASMTPVNAVTSVAVYNVVVPQAVPTRLFLSDDPEYLQSEGLVFRGDIAPDDTARLYYYHADTGAPRDLDVVLTSNVRSRVHLIASSAGPDLDVLSVGHAVTRDLLRFEGGGQGIVVDLDPGKPFVLRHALLLQGELVAGAVDVHVLSGGTVTASVVASAAGGRPDAYLTGPRMSYDGHGRHGTFALDGYGTLAQTYTVGGPDVALQYGGRTPSPRNLNENDPGHDYGDYGVIHRIVLTLENPTDTPQVVYLYEKPRAGPVRSTFIVDGQFKEIGCARMPRPYAIATYQLPAHFTGASTTVTMTDGGSFYPVEIGVTATQPDPNPPAVGTADGCSPNLPPFAAVTPPPSGS